MLLKKYMDAPMNPQQIEEIKYKLGRMLETIEKLDRYVLENVGEIG